MARLASSTIFIQTDTSTISDSEIVQLYYGFGTSNRILDDRILTVGDLNDGVCIPGNTVPSTETTITVRVLGECQIEEYIPIEAVLVPTPTPTVTPTVTPPSITPTPTITPTPINIPGELFSEDFIYVRGGVQDDGRIVWNDTSFSSISSAQSFLSQLCNLSGTPSQSVNYPVASQIVAIYSNTSPYPLINRMSFVIGGSTASYVIEPNQITIRLNNVFGISGSITQHGNRYVFT
jgi:hypothetical protein